MVYAVLHEPLRTYVKQYGQALGDEGKTCPPTVYHLPDDRVHEIIHGDG